ASFAYDDLGRRISITRGNGTATSYSFDAVSRLSQIIDNPAGTTHDRTLGFSYNPASQIVGTTRSNDLFAWAGHGSGTTGSTANGLNQISVHGGGSTSHDARGNMTADGLGKTFGYSSENLLTSASGGVSLSYDPARRLYQVSGATTTRFAYDGVDLIAEYNAGNTLQRRFIHGPGTDEPLVWYEGSGTTDRRFLHADERGSIVGVSNNSGSVTNVNTYDEYGKPVSTNVGRFHYTGQKWIGELGLYDYKARMYHPTLGRFMQPDPIGYGAGMNMQAYVGGDPVNLVDPTGLKDAVPGAGSCDEGFTFIDGYCSILITGSGGGSGLINAMRLDDLARREAPTLPYDPSVFEPYARPEPLTWQGPSIPPAYCSKPLYKLGARVDGYGKATQFAGQSIVVAGLVGAGVGSVAGGAGAAPGLGLAGLGAEVYGVGGAISLGGNLMKAISGDGRSFSAAVADTFQTAISNIGAINKIGQVVVGTTTSTITGAFTGADPCE
ncbi:MAG TPA: RHS repeat-associated core domain-containing protein, partial [Allosphingosinicella sp.]